MKHLAAMTTLIAVLLGAPPLGAQVQDLPPAPRVAVIFGRTQAINYKLLRGTARIGFRGSVLLPQASGSATVRTHEGGALLKAAFENLEPASRFGPEYMTYVLWAVSPVGQVTNLGEVVVKGSGRARITATTHLPSFGLILSAEPHFAVTQVSDLVVAENVLTEGGGTKVEEAEASFRLLPKGTCLLEANPAALTPPRLDRRVSPYVVQARNAMRIARAEQAERFAAADFARALTRFEEMERQPRLWKKRAVLLARQTAQLAEEARVVGVKQREAWELTEERKAAEDARARAEAARAAAEAERVAVEADREQVAREARKSKAEAVEAARRESAQRAQAALRRRLREQLGALLDTQDTERGLIVRMSDLLFPTGQAVLRPQAREKVAKVAGILMVYPGLRVKVEGHADSTGAKDFNRRLSAARAASVRNYLVRQGISPQSITAEGLGDGRPAADNDTPSGRQQNRRVELIVGGDPIGMEAGALR